jgi:hypothetical protein
MFKMKKLQKILLLFALLLSTILCGATASAQSILDSRFEELSPLVLFDASSNELYEFDNLAVKEEFLKQQQVSLLRSYQPYETRHVFARRYNRTHRSGNLITTAYGGQTGATISRSLSTTTSLDGLSISHSESVSYNVPPRKNGNIRLESVIQYEEYRIERRYNGGHNKKGKWQYAGKYTKKKVISKRFVPVIW